MTWASQAAVAGMAFSSTSAPLGDSGVLDPLTLIAFAAPGVVILLLIVDLLAAPRRPAANPPMWLIVAAAISAALTLGYAAMKGEFVYVAAQAASALVFFRVALVLSRRNEQPETQAPRFPVVAPDAAKRERKSNPPS